MYLEFLDIYLVFSFDNLIYIVRQFGDLDYIWEDDLNLNVARDLEIL